MGFDLDRFEELVTFAPDGSLVYLDGTPVPPLPPPKVCENTLQLYRQDRDQRRRLESGHRATLHERAMVRRRKRKRGGPR